GYTSSSPNYTQTPNPPKVDPYVEYAKTRIAEQEALKNKCANNPIINKLNDPYYSLFLNESDRFAAERFMEDELNLHGGQISLPLLTNNPTPENMAILGAIRGLTAVHGSGAFDNDVLSRLEDIEMGYNYQNEASPEMYTLGINNLVEKYSDYHQGLVDNNVAMPLTLGLYTYKDQEKNLLGSSIMADTLDNAVFAVIGSANSLGSQDTSQKMSDEEIEVNTNSEYKTEINEPTIEKIPKVDISDVKILSVDETLLSNNTNIKTNFDAETPVLSNEWLEDFNNRYGPTGINKQYSDNIGEHIEYVENFSRDVTKGMTGGHNLEEFYDFMNYDLGLSESEFLVSKTPHPDIDGIYEITYKIPSKDIYGNITGEKIFQKPKTVYDPNIITTNEIIKWGKEALDSDTVTVNGRQIDGYAPNGLKFRGYLDDFGVVTNFHPIFEGR
ncbi:MAG: CdiA family toxin C-terminal domain-containing protein, partial [Oscillospiraceae bacterium]|nr:CdiA family toxin C-terminal domain-containing protein [Oscillospiraceae bacterium]